MGDSVRGVVTSEKGFLALVGGLNRDYQVLGPGRIRQEQRDNKKGLFGALELGTRGNQACNLLKPIKDLWYGMGVGGVGGFCRGGGTPGKGFSSWRIQSA